MPIRSGQANSQPKASLKRHQAKIRNVSVDFENGTVRLLSDEGSAEYKLDTPEGIEAVGRAWIRASWDAKYVYSFTWMGRPIIQLPDDAFRMQELIYRVKPDVIIETGIAHGGSLIFYASLCKSMEKGRIVGVDVEIRPHNRKAIEAHELFPLIAMVEGDSTSLETVGKVKSLIAPGERVMVILDSCHSKQHVLAELNAYSPLVSVDSYIVAMDGVMQEVAGGPRTSDDWTWNNPMQAALEFVEANPAFQIEAPSFAFNEGSADTWITYSPNGVIKRLR